MAVATGAEVYVCGLPNDPTKATVEDLNHLGAVTRGSTVG